MREGLNSAEVRAEIINVLNVYLLFFLSLYPPLKLPKKNKELFKGGKVALLCLSFLHGRLAGLSRVTVLEFMQISPLAEDKNDYFIFLLTLQLSSSQCCIITTYSLFVSHFCDPQCDVT